MIRAGRRGRGGAAEFFLVIGCLTVVGVTFLLGVVTGRAWPSFPFGARSAAIDKALTDKGDRSARPPAPTPTLTFYRELTAPLTSPPPAKPPKRARVEKAEPAPQLPASPTPSPTESAASVPAPPPAASDGRFTVQVGAYKARQPAEALRVRLAAAGYDAYIAETDGWGGARFRVRVGAFVTRQAANELAARIAAERSVATFVTTR